MVREVQNVSFGDLNQSFCALAHITFIKQAIDYKRLQTFLVNEPFSYMTTPVHPTIINMPQTFLSRSSALQSLLIKISSAYIWESSIANDQTQWNGPIETLLDLASGSNPSLKYIISLTMPEAHLKLAYAVEACVATQASFDEQVQVVTAQGKRLWLRLIGFAVCDDAGRVVQLHGVLQDVTESVIAQQAARAITMRLGATLASISEAFATLDQDGRFTFVNPFCQQLLRTPDSKLLGQSLWLVLDVIDGHLRHEIMAALAGNKVMVFEVYSAHLGAWLELRAHPFDDGLALYLRDVSGRRYSQQQLALLQTCISRMNDIVLIAETSLPDAPSLCIVFVNDAFEQNTGYSRAEVLGHSPRMLQGPLTQSAELERIRRALTNAEPVRAELISYRKNGQRFLLELEITPVDSLGRGLTHWIAVGRDITDRKAAADEIEHLAFYDALTQLPNRQLLLSRLRYTLTQESAQIRMGALMFIDLDYFKLLNDTKGHSKGDLLLKKVATRLLACVRQGDTVARLGGDEFVVMLQNLGGQPAEAIAIARKVGEAIRTSLGEPYDLAGYAHHSTCSIGITAFNQHDNSIEDLLKQADLAMYQAKAAGRDSVCFFDPSMQLHATTQATLSVDLRNGLRDQEFLLHYQPQVGPQGSMVGVEALLRWQHPARGLVMPDEFIAHAEASGLIVPLGQWALEMACDQLALWATRPETASLSIAVNVSIRQFRHPEFVEWVMHVIKTSGIEPRRLKLELTETLLATGLDVTIEKMAMLKAAGVTLSIDDFGIGYSALSHLKHLPIDQLKIDRSFVKDVLTDANDAAIARTIIGLAQSLGLGVMAEGVETEEQRDFLARHGCRCYQGYLFCKPLPIKQLEAFMHRLSPSH